MFKKFKEIFSKKYFTNKDRTFFVSTLSLLLESELTVKTALETIAISTKNKALTEIVNELVKAISGGESASAVLAKSNLLPETSVSLLKVGEDYGLFDEVIAIISEQYEDEQMFKRQLFSALLYPAFISLLAIAIAGVLSLFVLPRLATVFAQIRVPLPQITQIIIDLGQFLDEFGVQTGLIFVSILLITIYILFLNHKTRKYGDLLLLRIPILRELLKQIELSRVFKNMALIIEAGGTIIDALTSAKTISFLSVYRTYFEKLHAQIKGGNSFAESFKKIDKNGKFIPYTLQQIINNSEQVGKLPFSFRKISDSLKSRIDTTAQNFTKLLEPMMIFIIWLGVLVIALAVILPIYSIINSIQGLTN